MKVIETLIQAYPIPDAMLHRIAMVRGLNLDAEAITEVLISKEYNLADADIKVYLSTSPKIGQSGVTFDYLLNSRDALKKQANAIYKKYDDPLYEPEAVKPTYGYKGCRL